MEIRGFVKKQIKTLKDKTGYFKRAIELKRLEKYSNEIDTVLTKYNKKSCNETMMVKGLRKSDEETTNRKIHQEDLEKIVKQIAKGIGLNEQIVGIMGKHHDIGHTFLGHSGEWWISNILEDYGLGYFCHNTLGARELIYTNQIYDEIIEKIKVHNPQISPKALAKIKESLWLVIDGINAHNGEKPEKEYIPDITKKEEEFEQEMLNCYTKKGYDKTIIPATSESCLMRLADQISYIPLDMVDGLRNGLVRDKNGNIVTTLDDDYINVLSSLGITHDEIQEANTTKNFTKIAERVKEILINDVIRNSTKQKITMSKEVMTLMNKLRTLNNEKAVNNVVLIEDQSTYPPAIRALINRYADIILSNGLLEKLQQADKIKTYAALSGYEGTVDEAFIKYISSTNPKDFEFTQKIVEQATRQSIKDELQTARQVVQTNGQYKEKQELGLNYDAKNTRIKNYMKYYTKMLQSGQLVGYNEASCKQEVENIMRNIQSGAKNKNYLNMEQRTATALAAKYISTLNDKEFIQLLQATQLINTDQYQSLTRPYKNIQNLKQEVYIQSNWKTISEEQKQVAQGQSVGENR